MKNILLLMTAAFLMIGCAHQTNLPMTSPVVHRVSDGVALARVKISDSSKELKKAAAITTDPKTLTTLDQSTRNLDESLGILDGTAGQIEVLGDQVKQLEWIQTDYPIVQEKYRRAKALNWKLGGFILFEFLAIGLWFAYKGTITAAIRGARGGI